MIKTSTLYHKTLQELTNKRWKSTGDGEDLLRQVAEKSLPSKRYPRFMQPRVTSSSS